MKAESVITLAVWLALGTSAWAEPAVRVMVTLPPQRTFVERLGGDRVAVDVMVAPGFDPHAYEPRPAQLVALERTQVYFAIGDPFEAAWLSRLTGAGRAKVVRTDEGIQKLGAHPGLDSAAPAGADPHIWLAPLLVKIQARNIRDGLIAADPAGSADYGANYERFAKELETMDGQFRRMFHGLARREFVVFHPAWGYFAQAYGLTQIAVEVDGKTPAPAQMQQLVERMRRQNIRVLFAQPHRALRMAETVAASVGAKVVIADDLAEEWEPNLRAVARELSTALAGATQ